MSVSYGGDSIVFADGSVNSSGFIGHRNRIINGAMMIDQRNAGASVTTTFPVDRFGPQYGSGTLTLQQTTSIVPAGFTYALGITVTSVGTRNAGDFFDIFQNIEGLNVADFGFGAANAATVTISFWVRSSVIGTYAGVLASGDNTRSYSFTYTISSANTWEQKSITVAGDTSGGTTAYPINNAAGLRLKLDLGSGTNYQITAGSWQVATNKIGNSSQVGWAQTAGATFYITGVQLERGSTASSFEYRPFGTELALCQRYFEKSYDTFSPVPTNTTLGNHVGIVDTNSLSAIAANIKFRVEKRTNPTMNFYKYDTTSGVWAKNSDNSNTGTITTPWGMGSTGVGRIDSSTALSSGAMYHGQWSATAEF
jgi:hypothetical protein